MKFKTHTGEIIEGEKLTNACKEVADDLRALAFGIRAEDAYASHITEAMKDQFLADSLFRADQVQAGKIDNFTIWQRVNTVLTGECVALLSLSR